MDRGFNEIKKIFSDRQIFLLVNSIVADLAGLYNDNIIVIDRHQYYRALRYRLDILKKIRKTGFRTVIGSVLRSSECNDITRFSGAEVKWGYEKTVKEGMFLGVFNHHNNSGFYYTIVTILSLNLFLYEKGKTKWFYLLLFSLNIAGHFITFSRSYLLGFAAGSLLSLGSFIYFNKSRRLRFVGMASVLVVAIFIVFSQYKPLMLERLSMILTPAKEEGIATRFYQWRTARDIFKEHPVTGLGYVRFGKIFMTEYLEKYKDEIEKEYPNPHEILFQSPHATGLRELKLHLHSLYLTELARSGLIGLILILGFHVMMLLRFFRFLLAAGTPFVRAVSAWALFASVGVLAGEFFDYILDYSIFIVTFSFMQGFACMVFENYKDRD